MRALGIAEREPDPFGGHYERVGATSVLNGKAHEYAEFGIRRRLLSLNRVDRRHEAVAALGNGLDESLTTAVEPQALAQRRDVHAEIDLRDEDLGPNQVQKAILRHQASAMTNQHD